MNLRARSTGDESFMQEIAKLINDLRMSHGAALALAREVAHDGGLVTIGDLTMDQRRELIGRLEQIAAGQWEEVGA